MPPGWRAGSPRDNVASQKTLSLNGYVREGVLRRFMSFDDVRTDLVVYSRLPSDPAPGS